MQAELNDSDHGIINRAVLFRGVPPGLMQQILAQSHIRELQPGERLLSPDQDNQSIFLLLSGAMQVHINETHQEPLATLGTGDVVGEMSVLDSEKPSATVTATDFTRLLEVHESVIWRAIDATEGMARNLLYILSGRLRHNTVALLESLRRQTLFQRYADLDALTNLNNRRWLDRTLTELIEAEDQASANFSLIILDIDFFKRFNDSYGHPAGDAVLRQVSLVIGDNLRPQDAAARYGGEEFAIILPNAERGPAVQIAERLCDAVRRASLHDVAGQALPPVTISLGVAQYRAGQSRDELVAEADAALYRAKNSGRDRVVAD